MDHFATLNVATLKITKEKLKNTLEQIPLEQKQYI